MAPMGFGDAELQAMEEFERQRRAAAAPRPQAQPAVMPGNNMSLADLEAGMIAKDKAKRISAAKFNADREAERAARAINNPNARFADAELDYQAAMAKPAADKPVPVDQVPSWVKVHDQNKMVMPSIDITADFAPKKKEPETYKDPGFKINTDPVKPMNVAPEKPIDPTSYRVYNHTEDEALDRILEGEKADTMPDFQFSKDRTGVAAWLDDLAARDPTAKGETRLMDNPLFRGLSPEEAEQLVQGKAQQDRSRIDTLANEASGLADYQAALNENQLNRIRTNNMDLFNMQQALADRVRNNSRDKTAYMIEALKAGMLPKPQDRSQALLKLVGQNAKAEAGPLSNRIALDAYNKVAETYGLNPINPEDLGY